MVETMCYSSTLPVSEKGEKIKRKNKREEKENIGALSSVISSLVRHERGSPCFLSRRREKAEA